MDPSRRAAARTLARAAAASCGLMVLVSAAASVSRPASPAHALGTAAGTATVVGVVRTGDVRQPGQPIASGTSATEFTFTLPDGAACTGDSANDGYRVQSYMVPAAVDPASLQFNFDGPIPTGTGASFSQPLYDVGTSAYLNGQTANATNPGGPGPVVNVPAFSFAVWAPGDIGAGTYNVGIACTLGPASTTQNDKFWNATMTIAVAAAGGPAQITWVAASPPTGVSTTTTTTTTGSTSTSTSAVGATTTRPATTVRVTSSVPAGTPTTVARGSLAGTGWSPPVAVWAALLLVFGRMAVLLGRTAEVRTRNGGTR